MDQKPGRKGKWGDRQSPFTLKSEVFDLGVCSTGEHLLKKSMKEDDDITQQAKQNIEQFFIQERGYDQHNLVIDQLADDKGANLHFTVLDNVSHEKFHVKTSSTHFSSRGTRYNQLLVYKILDQLGLGPHESSAMINCLEGLPDSTKLGYDPNMNLMIITSDLSNPHPTQQLHFRTKQDAQDLLDAGDDSEMALYSNAPQSVEENVQRCCVALLASLLGMYDIQANKGNVGLQEIKEGSDVVMLKPYIIDFTLGVTMIDPIDIAAIFLTTDNYMKESVDHRLDYHAQFDDDNVKALALNGFCFAFTLDDEVRRQSLQTIFGPTGHHIQNIIHSAFNEVKTGCQLQDYGTLDNKRQLGQYCKEISQRFAKFYNETKQILDVARTESSDDNMSIGSEEHLDSEIRATSPVEVTPLAARIQNSPSR